jgi:DNA-binding beta-propeller fold protein YncE
MSVFVLGCPDDGGDADNNPPPPPLPPPEELNVAFVLTTDFSTGSYSVVDLDTRRVTPDINLGGVHSDATARFFNGRIYVVNQEGVDSIQIIHPEADFTTPAGAELSVGNGMNPQDIVFINATKAYVSLYASTDLLIINPTTLQIRGRINLANRTKPGDGDRAPELFRMLFHDGLVYLLLQHLDFTADPDIPAKVAPGEIVIIDPDTDRDVGILQLNGENPFSDIVFSPALNRILVSSVGDFQVLDGGIEVINPNTRTVERGFRVTEAALGGDITHFAIVSATKGFAIVLGAGFSNALVTFNPTTGARLDTLFSLSPTEGFLPHFAINRRGELYLAVNATTPTPRLRVFDVAQDRQIGTVRSGDLPPWFVLFIEEPE